MPAICRCRGRSSTRAWWQRPDSTTREEEKAAIKAGKSAAEIWPDEPAKAAQKDTDARWTVKTSKGKVEADGTVKRDLAIPAFGYKSHIGIDRRHGFIRRQKVTDAAAHDGARLREGLIDPTNTACDVWADTAYRSQANEDFLADRGQRQPYPSQKACWQADATAHGQGQCQEVQGPCNDRARLRAAEGPHEAHHPQHRPQARRGDDRHGQHRLQSWADGDGSRGELRPPNGKPAQRAATHPEQSAQTPDNCPVKPNARDSTLKAAKPLGCRRSPSCTAISLPMVFGTE